MSKKEITMISKHRIDKTADELSAEEVETIIAKGGVGFACNDDTCGYMSGNCQTNFCTLDFGNCTENSCSGFAGNCNNNSCTAYNGDCIDYSQF